jgi:methylmalonyl-CoA mutase
MAHAHEPWLGGFPEVAYETWRRELEPPGKEGTFEKRLVTRTLEGIDVQPLYHARDWPSESEAGGYPGAPPYRRGAHALGRSGARWDMRPRYEQPDLRVLQQEIRADLARGATSLWLCFDRQARGGQARKAAPRALYERGVPCLTAAPLSALLNALPSEGVAVSLDAGGNALPVAACWLAAAQLAGRALDELRGSFNADPLGALARDGALPCSLSSAQLQVSELAQWCVEHAPGLRALNVSVVAHHDAGAHAAQEIGIALATGVAYLRWLTDAGMGIDAACSQLGFSVAVGSDFFMEIAKLRALRQTWAQVVTACGGGAEAQRCNVHAVTSTRTKTLRDPWVNMLRETTEAFAAAAGNADAITTAGFDRLAGSSDAFARRIAGNAQAILDQEAHVAQVADPAGGAWYVEQLTDQLAASGWELLQTIERAGGMAAALAAGTIAEALAGTASERAARIAKRKQAITGVSEFAHVNEAPLARPEPDWNAIEAQRELVLTAANATDADAEAVIIARKAKRGVVSAAIDAARAGANLEQLSRALAGSEPPARMNPLPIKRDAADYEALRDACDAAAARTGQRPAVFLCNLGPIPQHAARAQFAGGFFAAGGLAVIGNDGFATPDDAASAFAQSGTALVVLCGSDDAYPEWVEPLVPKLRAAGAKQVLLAGRPRGPELEARYRAAGIDEWIFVGCDVVQSLRRVLASVGVTP